MEAFFCNFNEGKDRDDLNGLRDFYVKQSQKAGLAVPDAYLWTLNKGGSPNAMIWVNMYESLTAFAAANDAYRAAPETDEVDERSEEIIACEAHLGQVSYVFVRDPEQDDAESATLASYACNLRPGHGPAHVGALLEHIASVNASMGDGAMDALIQISPATGTLTTPDLYVVAVSYRGAAAWAQHLADLEAAPGGRAVLAHFNDVLDCQMGLWDAERIVDGNRAP